MKIALLDDYQDVALRMAEWTRLGPQVQVDAIHDHIPDLDRLADRLLPYDVIMAVRERTKFPLVLFERLPNLRLLITAAMWNIAIDLDAATAHDVQVCGTGDWPHATAELALGMLIALSRNIVKEDHALREGRWQTTLGVGLHGKTLGVVGLGSLGQQMAGFGRMLGMRVVAWSQNLTSAQAMERGAELVTQDELLTESDAVTIHLKLSDRTRGLFGSRELGLMKRTAFLINTSRGPIVDESALVSHLKEGRIAGAALDVYDLEPLPKDHPLCLLDNTLLLPHLGYVAEQNYRLIFSDALEVVEAFRDGSILRPLNTLSKRV